ncbi:MAG: glutathione S-transferase family protein [Caldimonas sp.]|nr:glutathione S-transferase family protein [Pseudomonadota bacterium]
MTDIVLHHYAGSPFSEKVRLVLGMKRLRWRSVDVPVMLPKPDVVALTGGYRRTPFMQIGADVYCDSALMCRVIDRLAPEPPLYPEATHGLDEIVAQWADTSLFWIAVPFTLQPAGAAQIFADAPPEFLRAFGADRAAMNPSMRRTPLGDATAMLNAYVGRLEAMLGDSRPFLLGALPSIADFSAAQSIWFVRRSTEVARHLAPFAHVNAWYERVAAFGHGEPTELSSADAIALARGSTTFAACAVAPDAGIAAGTPVGVTPADYAHDEVAGTLVGLDGEEVVVERHDVRAGTVHVHFPRIGFHVKAIVARKEGS